MSPTATGQRDVSLFFQFCDTFLRPVVGRDMSYGLSWGHPGTTLRGVPGRIGPRKQPARRGVTHWTMIEAATLLDHNTPGLVKIP
jgi:hypothetical protein